MEARIAVTIRFPSELLASARKVKGQGESLNDLVVEAVDREVRHRQGRQAFEEIGRLREAIRARSGVQPDSSSLIRALREGDERRD
jgi:hypothetical protein